MTKVLHLLNDVASNGNGIVNAVVDLACEQSALGHHVWVASAGGDYVGLLAEHRVGHLLVADVRRPAAVLSSAHALRTFVVDHDVQIIHAHMNFATVVARMAVTRTRARLVASAHTAFKREAALLGVADLVIALGDAGARTMRRRGVPARRLRVLQNGTVGSVRTRGDSVADLSRPSVVTVAGLYPRKGIDVLIDAFVTVARAHPRAQLHIVGDGPARQQYEHQAASTAVADRIHFHRYQQDVASFLRATDVFVLPSRRDPFPLVVLEARDAGCAVVASDIDGIPEACDGGRAGWLVPVEDPEALAAAVSELLSSPSELQRWRSAAREGLERFTVGRVARDVDRIYDEVLARRRPPGSRRPQDTSGG